MADSPALAMTDGSVPDAQARITRLGLTHHLVTRFTSFVAVDTTRRVGAGTPEQVVQPVERPEGVDVEAASGRITLSERKVTTRQEPAPAGKPRAPIDHARRDERAGPVPMEPPRSSAAYTNEPDENVDAGSDLEEKAGDSDDAGAEEAQPEPEQPAVEDEASAYEPAQATAEMRSYSNEAQVESKRGCGCRVAGSSSSGGWVLAFALLGFALVRRSHRRSKRVDNSGRSH